MRKFAVLLLLIAGCAGGTEESTPAPEARGPAGVVEVTHYPMEYIVSRGLVPANKSAGQGGAEPEAELSDDQKSEIDRLIAEAESEIADLKKDTSTGDPLVITKTWEEQNQKSEKD